MAKLVSAAVAILAGIGGAVLVYWALNAAVERLPRRWEQRLKPYAFIGPALLLVGVFLVYPAVRTIALSFYGPDSEEFVGVRNYLQLAEDPRLRSAIFNNVLWIVVAPLVAVAVGLAVAVLADRLRPRTERLTKSLIFLPMAISFVGASTIWGFVYAYRPAPLGEIGLLNAVWTAVGGQRQAWLQVSQWQLNDLLLIFIMIWLQTGFAMVLLSTAIKNVPGDTIDAARVDGANELQIFWKVVVPQIRSTMLVVLTTIVILVLKVFDIVYVTTGGRFDTDIVANRFITELLIYRQFGRAAAIVTALIVVVIPVMAVNVRRYRAEEAVR
jgi:alpha-glucoside transport system permease protein